MGGEKERKQLVIMERPQDSSTSKVKSPTLENRAAKSCRSPEGGAMVGQGLCPWLRPPELFRAEIYLVSLGFLQSSNSYFIPKTQM
jgi:hypothetical protein